MNTTTTKQARAEKMLDRWFELMNSLEQAPWERPMSYTKERKIREQADRLAERIMALVGDDAALRMFNGN